MKKDKSLEAVRERERERELQFSKIKERGITLVALAVTITVMLILGTISINAMFGENGVLKKAKEQGSKTKGTISESEAKTNQLMQDYENMMAGGVGNEVDEASQEIIDNLKQQIEELQKQNEELTKTNEELKAKQATGDATEDQVLSGATFSTSNGVGLTGKMETLTTADWNGDKINKQVDATSTVVGNASDNDKTTEYVYFGITKNRYTGDNQWVRAKAADLRKTLTSSANAGAGQILSGYTGYVNGNKITGTMPSNASSANVQSDKAWLYSSRVYFGIPYGYYPSATFGGMSGVSERYITYSSLASAIGLTAGKLASGQSVLGISGTYTSDANAGAGQILSGYTGYVKGSKITGTIANENACTNAISIGNDGSSLYFRIPRGAYLTNMATGYPEIKASISNINKTIGSAVIKHETYTLTSSSDTGTFYNGSGGTVKKYYVTVSLGDKKVISSYYSRADITSGGYDYNVVSANGSCAWMNTTYFFNLAHDSSNWNQAVRINLPVRSASKSYKVEIWYIDI